MNNNQDEFFTAVEKAAKESMNPRQAPLMELYTKDPDAARIVDCAHTSSQRVPASSPMHTEVFAAHGNDESYGVGVHRGVGGDSDYPTPGDILCAAIAACLDSCIRIIANKVSVRLKSLSVHVEGNIDLRGTLRVDDTVPVGFQNMSVRVDLVPEQSIPAAHIDAIVKAAEHSCVIIQTLRSSPEISISLNEARTEKAA